MPYHVLSVAMSESLAASPKAMGKAPPRAMTSTAKPALASFHHVLGHAKAKAGPNRSTQGKQELKSSSPKGVRVPQEKRSTAAASAVAAADGAPRISAAVATTSAAVVPIPVPVPPAGMPRGSLVRRAVRLPLKPMAAPRAAIAMPTASSVEPGKATPGVPPPGSTTARATATAKAPVVLARSVLVSKGRLSGVLHQVRPSISAVGNRSARVSRVQRGAAGKSPVASPSIRLGAQAVPNKSTQTLPARPVSHVNATNPTVTSPPLTAPAAPLHAVAVAAKAASPAMTGAMKAVPPTEKPLQGWTIQPGQVQNIAGIRQSSWTIRPPALMGPPMKMEIAQQGSQMTANLTVSAGSLGLLNATPTALPHQAVHLPEGVTNLVFSLSTQGGSSGEQAGQPPHEPFEGVARPPGYQVQSERGPTQALNTGNGQRGLDYRA